MRVVVTGATGLLGQTFIEEVLAKEAEWELVSLSRHEPPESQRPDQRHGRPRCSDLRSLPFWQGLDVGNLEATRSLLTRLNPDVVVHMAAIRSPDDCERDPDAAFRINFLGARNVALACDRFDTELMFISSDQVFYGVTNKTLHREWDAPRAANIYGQTKILAENYIREHLRRYWIVRTAKLFGGPNDKTSFVNMAFASLAQDKPINVVKEWASHVTHAKYAASAMIELIRKKIYGIYHVVSPGVPSYWEIGEYLVSQMNKPRALLAQVSQKDLRLPAVRAEYLALSAEIWKADFNKPLPSWQEGIKLFLSERKSRLRVF